MLLNQHKRNGLLKFLHHLAQFLLRRSRLHLNEVQFDTIHMSCNTPSWATPGVVEYHRSLRLMLWTQW